ncbi:short-chain dehydrogenase/reductase family protein [Gracilibacillus halophilus YIM-C55.5]|uniref:Short-chain dehydrogenase/reductase family protein n=1 Tax=Gracilibacillus halophilus YIM-C55.5 TaxID=1308866 RepID=N4WPV6_9BACI|nr:SDR family oxidoreductase [Gracilibacillus halophilus]ENH98147.1 short-chain dehydrogenase/reductase family protein [Gracilibacillus halophilus YIM-C55.5]
MTIFSSDALRHRHILITGATGDIGYETAKVLISMGAKLTATGRNVDKLNQLRRELLETTDEKNFCVMTADITKEADRNELMAYAEKQLGFISGLVNAAGIAGNKKVEDLDESMIEQMMQVNYLAAFSLTKPIYQKMIKHQQGDIVNIASLSGLRGTYGNTAYASSKFAMIGWTQSMAHEAIKHQVRVNAVCPGFVDTDMAENLIQIKAERNQVSYDHALEQAKQSVPSGRFTTAEEVAQTIAFLLTDAANNIVGESVKISGGSVMR